MSKTSWCDFAYGINHLNWYHIFLSHVRCQFSKDLCPEDISVLPKTLSFTAPNKQSMQLLNVLLKKQDAHDIETIDFGGSVDCDDIVGTLQEQLEALTSIAGKCAGLLSLRRFVFSPFKVDSSNNWSCHLFWRSTDQLRLAKKVLGLFQKPCPFVKLGCVSTVQVRVLHHATACFFSNGFCLTGITIVCNEECGMGHCFKRKGLTITLSRLRSWSLYFYVVLHHASLVRFLCFCKWKPVWDLLESDTDDNGDSGGFRKLEAHGISSSPLKGSPKVWSMLPRLLLFAFDFAFYSQSCTKPKWFHLKS